MSNLGLILGTISFAISVFSLFRMLRYRKMLLEAWKVQDNLESTIELEATIIKNLSDQLEAALAAAPKKRGRKPKVTNPNPLN